MASRNSYRYRGPARRVTVHDYMEIGLWRLVKLGGNFKLLINDACAKITLRL